MPRTIETYLSPTEATRARPALDTSCQVALSDFSELVGSYQYEKGQYVRCQLFTKGSLCRQSHGKGWIAKRKDGVEGYIGGDCSQQHFGTDRNFSVERKRALREMALDRLVIRLAALLARPDTRERVSQALITQRKLLQRLYSIRGRLPQAFNQRLLSFSKNVNRAVYLEFAYPYIDEEKKHRVRWQPEGVGAVQGLDVLKTPELTLLGADLEKISQTLDEAGADREKGEATLRKWAAALERLDPIENDLTSYARAEEAFTCTENLKLLPLLVANDSVKDATIEGVLQIMGDRKADELQVRRVRQQWEQEVRVAHDGRDFRIP